jgi:hypothetical protein
LKGSRGSSGRSNFRRGSSGRGYFRRSRRPLILETEKVPITLGEEINKVLDSSPLVQGKNSVSE